MGDAELSSRAIFDLPGQVMPITRARRRCRFRHRFGVRRVDCQRGCRWVRLIGYASDMEAQINIFEAAPPIMPVVINMGETAVVPESSMVHAKEMNGTARSSAPFFPVGDFLKALDLPAAGAWLGRSFLPSVMCGKDPRRSHR